MKKFLTSRADLPFVSDDYYESDVNWMDLDAPLDITIGPYETYNDEIFGYKAGFEAYVNVRDEEETGKLGAFTHLLQQIEDNLPLDPQYRNPKLGGVGGDPSGGPDIGYGSTGPMECRLPLTICPTTSAWYSKKRQQASDVEECPGSEVSRSVLRYRLHGGRYQNRRWWM